jgi:nucleoside-diphosphate-sugar epimerase
MVENLEPTDEDDRPRHEPRKSRGARLRVFVAGATGVIGRRVVTLLVKAGHDVVGLSRSADRAAILGDLGAQGVVGDAFDRARLVELITGLEPEIVIHELTDLPKALNPRKIDRELVGNDRLRTEGTRNLVDAAQAGGVNRIIAQSVAFLYAPIGGMVKAEDDPLDVDGERSLRRTVRAVRDLEEAVLTTPGIDSIVLRYGYFYGPGTAYASDGSIAGMVRRRAFPIAGGGGGVFSFVHLDDAAEATVRAISAPPGIYNVVDDSPAPLADWLPVFAAELGAKPPRRVPTFVARLIAGSYGAHLSTSQRGASNGKAKTLLDWHPRDWRQGLLTS